MRVPATPTNVTPVRMLRKLTTGSQDNRSHAHSSTVGHDVVTDPEWVGLLQQESRLRRAEERAWVGGSATCFPGIMVAPIWLKSTFRQR